MNTPFPVVGQCIRLSNDVDRYPDFLAKAGMIGIVTSVEEDVIIAKMHQPLSGDPLGQALINEVWENSIHWYPMDFPPQKEEEEWTSVTALENFLEDCELIECPTSSV